MAETRREPIVQLPQKTEVFVLVTIGALSSTILLKIASIQYLELLELVLLVYVALRFLRNNLRIEMSRGMFRLVAGYGLLSLLIMLGCALAFTRPFYLATYGLNAPGVVSAARLAELVLGVFATILLTQVFRRSPGKCLLTARVYFAVGTLSAFLGLLGIVLKGPFSLFVAERRTSGFYNEGGPYGLYLISVMVVGWCLTRVQRRWGSPLLFTAMAINAIALVFSASKAAYLAIVLLMVLGVVLAGGRRQRIISLMVAVAGVVAVLTFTNAGKGINAYVQGGRRFEAISQLRPNDINFSYGRVAAIFFVPRMIAQHPWTGVGFANYGLVRNAPEYRGNAAVAVFVDHDALGIPGLTAELGIPATLLLVYLLLQPGFISRRLTGSKPILALAFMQPVVHMCGAQLNVTYPWIVSAIALGMASMHKAMEASQTPALVPKYESTPNAVLPSFKPGRRECFDA